MLSILVIADCQADYLLMRDSLEQAGVRAELTRVATREALMEMIAAHPWAAVLSDYGVPGMDFRQTAELLAQALPDVPLILVSGSIGEEEVVDLLKLGVRDVVLKENLARLPLALSRSLKESAEIRARRGAEARLGLFAAALEAAANAVLITDGRGEIEWVNPAYTKLTGYSKEETLGRNPRELVKSGVHDPSIYQALWQTILAGRVWQGEMVNRRRDGTLYTEFETITPVRDVQGRITHFIAVKEDVSGRKAAEAALGAHREHLEEVVAIRTADLQVARRQAEQAASAKSEFLANMSHEIRTPLNAILGFAQVGQKEDAGRRSADLFLRILDSGQLLMGLINDILDFSKIEAGKMSLEDGSLDLGQMLDRVAGLAAERAQARGIAFHVDESPDLPARCRGDALRLAQVLLNLLSNAVKFTESGEVRLSALCEGGELVLAVTDTGIGMAPDELARLFHPFEQADSSTTRRYGGTGLGLTISKRLMDLMGGTIRVESARGEGSRFEIRLPIREPSGLASARGSWAVAGRVERPVSKRLAGYSILAAEDNEPNRLVLEDLLGLEGARLVCVENGLLAVERLQQDGPEAFDVVLTDIQMPVMDGHEAAKRLRALAPDLPIIGLTAHAMPEEKARCLASGMVAHLAKPIEADLLVNTILEHAPVGRAAAESVPVAEPAGMVDWLALNARYKNRTAFIAKLVATVLESTADTSPQLREAASNGDLPRMAMLAHSLKGMSANIAAQGFREQAAGAEMAAREERADAASLAVDLAGALERLREELLRHSVD